MNAEYHGIGKCLVDYLNHKRHERHENGWKNLVVLVLFVVKCNQQQTKFKIQEFKDLQAPKSCWRLAAGQKPEARCELPETRS